MAIRAKSLRYVLVGLIASACLVSLPASSQAQDQSPGRYPGLPFVECPTLPGGVDCAAAPDSTNDNGWVNFVQVGVAGSSRAKQWARVPLAVMSNAISIGYVFDLSNPPEYLLGRDVYYDLQAFFVSPVGSTDNYGLSPVIRVNTVAFGSIPAEISLQLEQRRDAAGQPYPLNATQTEQLRDEVGGVRGPSIHRTLSVELNELVSVKVVSLRLDGIDLGLSSACETGPTASLALTSNPVEGEVQQDGTRYEYDGFDPATGFYGLSGGTLVGDLDIPAFQGCATQAGDDVSDVLTATISGPDNPLEIRVGALDCVQTDGGIPFQRQLPAAPGSTTPDSINCVQRHPNPLVKTVPAPLQFPTYAPGAQP